MTRCSRSLVAVAVVSALIGWAIGAGAVWFAVRQHHSETPIEQLRDTAALLVGKWKFVKSNTKPPTEFQLPIEFTHDGKLILAVENDLRNTPVTSGCYRLVGDTLWLYIEPCWSRSHGSLKMKDLRVTIETVTEDRLVTVAWAGEHERHTFEYERVREEGVGQQMPHH